MTAAGALAPMLTTFTIEPPPAAVMCGTARRIVLIAANTLRSRSSCQPASSTDISGAACDLPALFTSTSSRPNRSTVASNSRVMSSSWLTSAGTSTISPPVSSRIELAASASVLAVRAADHDLRALTGQRARRGQADAGAAAGHNRHLAFEAQIHRHDLPRSPGRRPRPRAAESTKLLACCDCQV